MQEHESGITGGVGDISSFLRHFQALMGPRGLYQHTTIRQPLLSEGYCTDDNARAVQMLARLLPLVSLPAEKETITSLLNQCWKFLYEAQVKPGYFNNFRSADGEWLPKDQSEDMYVRLIRAFAEIMATPELSAIHAQTDSMLAPLLLERASHMQAPRFWAELLIALTVLPFDRTHSELIVNFIHQAQEKLTTLWQTNASEEWPWFEDTMTYANAIFPHGTVAGLALHPSHIQEEILHQSTAFLITSTIEDDIYMPIGSNGWYPKGGVASHDNQQAIEANTMFDFLLAYNRAFPGRLRVEEIAAPYLWFFGKNTNSVVMADESTGACLDGIFTDGPNPNHGAESMLAYQWAEILQHTAPSEIQAYIAQERARMNLVYAHN